MMKSFWFSFLICFAVLAGPAHAQIRYEEILKLNERFAPEGLQYAKQQGAEIMPTRDGRSFVLWWQPENFNPQKDTVLVSMHGHGGWADKDFQIWHPFIKGRGYAFLGVQWWYGRSMESFGYAKPAEIYPWIRQALEAKGIPPKHVIFTGFSMGGANCYAVAYQDHLQPQPYFAVVIGNAGAMEADFPPNAAFLNSKDPMAFTGMNFFLYCSEHDEQRPQSCEKMQWTKEQIENRGGTVHKFIKDPVHGHGGFMRPENHGPVLAAADLIVSQEK